LGWNESQRKMQTRTQPSLWRRGGKRISNFIMHLITLYIQQHVLTPTFYILDCRWHNKSAMPHNIRTWHDKCDRSREQFKRYAWIENVFFKSVQVTIKSNGWPVQCTREAAPCARRTTGKFISIFFFQTLLSFLV
jgi:hypothetical protein